MNPNLPHIQLHEYQYVKTIRLFASVFQEVHCHLLVHKLTYPEHPLSLQEHQSRHLHPAPAMASAACCHLVRDCSDYLPENGSRAGI